MLQCETLAQAAAGTALQVGMPTAEQSALLSPVEPACAPQDHLEAVLLRHLRAAAGARVRVRHRGRRASTTGPTACVRSCATRSAGTTRVVRARYLVAADGAHSTVRRALGIPMRGPDHLAEVVTALFRAPLWDVLGEFRHGIYSVTAPEAPGLFLPAGRDDRWLYGVYWDPEVEQAGRLRRGAAHASSSGSARACPTSSRRSSGSAPSRSPRRSPTTSGRTARS